MAISLVSCEEIIVNKKEVFIKKVTSFDFYEGGRFINNKDQGLILNVIKSETDGDTNKCELLLRQVNLYYNLDLAGNIVKKTNAYLRHYDNNLVLNNGFYYKCFSGDKPRLVKYNTDNDDIELESKSLDYSKFTNVKFYPELIVSLTADTFIAYNIPIVENRKGKYIYKQQFCTISMKNGVEKVVLENVELENFNSSRYFLNSNNELVGLLYSTDSQKNTSKVLIRKYDLNFNLLDSKDYLSPEFLYFSKIFFDKKDESIVVLGSNITIKSYIIRIENDFKVTDHYLGNGVGVSSFINSNLEKLYFFINDNSKKTKSIFIKNTDFTSEKIGEIPIDFPLSHLQETNRTYEYFGVYTGDNQNKKSIEVHKIDRNGNLTVKRLFNSQYTRNCNRREL